MRNYFPQLKLDTIRGHTPPRRTLVWPATEVSGPGALEPAGTLATAEGRTDHAEAGGAEAVVEAAWCDRAAATARTTVRPSRAPRIMNSFLRYQTGFGCVEPRLLVVGRRYDRGKR